MSTDTVQITDVRATDLIGVVTAVPGVRGIEPGVASTLRTLDARLRRHNPSAARYGLIVDQETGDVTVEVALYSDLPVRSVVEDVQRSILRALGHTETGRVEPGRPRVLVRVQSLTAE